MCQSHLGHPERSWESNFGISSSLQPLPVSPNPNLKCFKYKRAPPVSCWVCVEPGSLPRPVLAHHCAHLRIVRWGRSCLYWLSACRNLTFSRCLVINFYSWKRTLRFITWFSLCILEAGTLRLRSMTSQRSDSQSFKGYLCSQSFRNYPGHSGSKSLFLGCAAAWHSVVWPAVTSDLIFCYSASDPLTVTLLQVPQPCSHRTAFARDAPELGHSLPTITLFHPFF